MNHQHLCLSTSAESNGIYTALWMLRFCSGIRDLPRKIYLNKSADPRKEVNSLLLSAENLSGCCITWGDECLQRAVSTLSLGMPCWKTLADPLCSVGTFHNITAVTDLCADPGQILLAPWGLPWWLRSPSSSAQASAFPLHCAKAAEDAGAGTEVPKREELEKCRWQRDVGFLYVLITHQKRMPCCRHRHKVSVGSV